MLTMPFTACPDKFQCRNNNCIKPALRCDGWNDCGDMSDEAECSKYHLVVMLRLHIFFNCSLYSYERICHILRIILMFNVHYPPFPGCNPTDISCRNGFCKPKFWKCDGVNDCGDNTDELDCKAL